MEARLQEQQAFRHVRTVTQDGRPVEQHVAEAAVTLDRVAWQNRVVGDRPQIA